MSRFDGLLDRVIAPWPLLAGVVVGFVACSVGGRAVSEVNLIQDFNRFHTHIHPSSGYYPTASQIHSLGVELLDPQKIAVVVGGNSILHGVQQRPDEVWIRHLQAELGDKYCVVNFAVPAAVGAEFGGNVAERLAIEHPKLILVTCGMPGGEVVCPDGYNYRYLFWDAREKNLLPADLERDSYLRENPTQHPDVATAEKFSEVQRRSRLDSMLYFQDLWSSFTYQVASPVWNPLQFSSAPPGKPAFSPLVYSRPRRMYPEPTHPRVPPGVGYVPAQHEGSMHVVRKVVNWRDKLAAELASPEESPIANIWRASFPQSMRSRTLVLAIAESPYYVRRLTADEQTCYRNAQQLIGPLLARSGFQTLNIGQDFDDNDYFDSRHLSEEGGRKLAAVTAPKIREIARELGFTKPEEGR